MASSVHRRHLVIIELDGPRGPTSDHVMTANGNVDSGSACAPKRSRARACCQTRCDVLASVTSRITTSALTCRRRRPPARVAGQLARVVLFCRETPRPTIREHASVTCPALAIRPLAYSWLLLFCATCRVIEGMITHACAWRGATRATARCTEPETREEERIDTAYRLDSSCNGVNDAR